MNHRLTILTLLLCLCNASFAQDSDSVFAVQDSTVATPFTFNIDTVQPKKHLWTALGSIAALNLTILAVDHYIVEGAYSHVTLRTIQRNLNPTKWWWDSDYFRTNLGEHPYTGGLYYNIARACGYNFWQSMPFVAFGSLMWEISGECEPPCYSDFIATTVGGMGIGEGMHRLSSAVYDDSERGVKRFFREFLGMAVNPTGGIARLITGEAWRVDNTKHYHDADRFPIRLTLSTGGNFIRVGDADRTHFWTAYLDGTADYGDPMEGENQRPYDFFHTNLKLVLGNHQQLFNQFNIYGQIWASETRKIRQHSVRWGIYQHFDYRYSDAIGNGSAPYRISEAASFGPGLLWEVGKTIRLRQGLFANAMLIGGASNDYDVHDMSRNYNSGSGFTLKSKTNLQFGNVAELNVNVDYLRMFTWLGFEDEKYVEEWHSTQGDKGNTALLTVDSRLNINVARHLSIDLRASHYLRHTNYDCHPYVSLHSNEFSMGMAYTF